MATSIPPRPAAALIAGVLALLWLPAASGQDTAPPAPASFTVSAKKKRVLTGTRARDNPLTITVLDKDGAVLTGFKGVLELRSAGQPIIEKVPPAKDGVLVLDGYRLEDDSVTVSYGGVSSEVDLAGASWISLMPPLLAIGLALWFRQVLLSLFGGVWLGNALITLTTPGSDLGDFVLDGFGFLSSVSVNLVGALTDPDHMKIVVFTLLMGGMVGIVAASGGTQALVQLISARARNARSAQRSTMAMGILIFFDDYANTILVGNTMRPFTDRFRVSREKLAYIVDSTAAPVAALFLVSTWIGYEVGLIGEVLEQGLPGQAYGVFIDSIPYRFYSIFGLMLVFGVTLLGRDFGPMLTAEIRARSEGKVLRDGAAPMMDEEALSEFQGASAPWWVAVAPIALLVVSILSFIVLTGYAPAQEKALGQLRQAAAVVGVEAGELNFDELRLQIDAAVQAPALAAEVRARGEDLLSRADFSASLKGVLGEASSYDALIWGSALGVFLALLLVVGGGHLKLDDGLKAFVDGVRSMVMAVLVLTLAWSLGGVCESLLAGQYVAKMLEGVPVFLLPTLTFLAAAVIAFATGTSWGTMAILFPVLGPLLINCQGEANFESIMLGCVGAVLAGSCFGDHASPISDTTVLSSMASGSDHIDHVRTQLPYACLAGAVAILLGFLPAGLGVPPWPLLLVGIALIFGVLIFIGRDPEAGLEKELAAAMAESAGSAKPAGSAGDA